jgi:hypothetical protein
MVSIGIVVDDVCVTDGRAGVADIVATVSVRLNGSGRPPVTPPLIVPVIVMLAPVAVVDWLAVTPVTLDCG